MVARWAGPLYALLRNKAAHAKGVMRPLRMRVRE